MYSIKEVATQTGLTAYTLRYYEKEGLIPPIKRDSGGRRSYSIENIAWINLVTCLKQTDMPIKAIKEIVKLSIEGDHTINDRKSLLVNHRENILTQIEELKRSIKKIDAKIDFYDGKENC